MTGVRYDEPTERGAETIMLPDGTGGYALAICDYTQPDGSVIRSVTLMEVAADGATDKTIHEIETRL